MTAFLVKWNPKRDRFNDLPERVTNLIHRPTRLNWSTGVTTSILPGDTIYLARIGVEPKGLMGSGTAVAPVQRGPHWDENRPDDSSLYVETDFDRLIDPECEPVLPLRTITDAGIRSTPFTSQGSGVRFNPNEEQLLEQIWTDHYVKILRLRNSPSFQQGKEYRRADLHRQFGGQQQGGISTPKDHPIVLLFTSETGKQYGYSDGFRDDGTFWYTGEGQLGNMQMTKGNLSIRTHEERGKRLHLFEYVRSGVVRYVGEAQYLQHREEAAPDANGTPRIAFVFVLAIRGSNSGMPVNLSHAERHRNSSLWNMSIEELRDRACQSNLNGVSSETRLRTVYERSLAVKVFVLRRANGVCEGCGEPAPFSRPDGTPYLEPHHIRRVSDEGPDHPRWVAAICPNCHRRVHHGEDGEQWNRRIAERVNRLEE